MKLKKQRFMAVLLALCLIMGAMPVSSLAAEASSFDATGGKVTYEIVNGETVTITGCDTTVTAIEIPDTIEGLPVTKIADKAFYNGESAHEALASVKLPSTLTEIGLSAFYSCTNLSDVDFTACTSLTRICNNAFQGDTALASVNFPTSLKHLGDYAFSNCGLTAVDLSGCTELFTIGAYAFSGDLYSNGNQELATVKLPPNVETISNDAFNNCPKLASVDFSSCASLSTIGECAFEYTGVTDVTLPASVTTIGFGAFAYCPQLTEADFSACTNLTVVEDSLFSNCSQLTSVKLPASVTVINKEAFAFCTALSLLSL